MSPLLPYSRTKIKISYYYIISKIDAYNVVAFLEHMYYNYQRREGKDHFIKQ